MAALPLLLGLALAACGDATGPTDPEDVEFAPDLGIDLSQMTRLPSGVYVQLVRTGTEPVVVSGSTGRLNYSLLLPDGTRVAAQDDVQFAVSPGDVIPGFLIGTVGMKTGEIRKIVIPSELGYGQFGTTGVPPHSVLVFSVEIVEVVSSP